ncbi:hypothetical protein KI387_010319, partial [Taxus chinensis]
KMNTPKEIIKREKCGQFKGVRLRKWGKWVSEVRMPKCRDKIWLGSFHTAEQAARAYDAAVYCLRGSSAKLNFPNCIPVIPSASSLSRHQIRLVATKYALLPIPSITIDNTNNSNFVNEEAPSPSSSSFLSQVEASSDSQAISSSSSSEEEQVEFASLWEWESLFDSELGDSNDNLISDWDKFPFPSVNTSPLELELERDIDRELEVESTLFDPFQLWSF